MRAVCSRANEMSDAWLLKRASERASTREANEKPRKKEKRMNEKVESE